MNIVNQLATELKLREQQIKATMDLLDEGNTIPFIARYRKEATGELDEVVLRDLAERLEYLRNLEARKAEIERLIGEQDKLTPELSATITKATTLQELEDIYRPYRPKRRTRASQAKEKGLEPLADIIIAQQDDILNLEELCQHYINEQVLTIDEAKQGALDILAERFADDASLRQLVRHYTISDGILVTEATKDASEEQALQEFKMYFDYQEPVKKIPPHRILAINRGERLKALRAKISLDTERILTSLAKRIIVNSSASTVEWITEAINDGYNRLIAPSIEREIRNQLTTQAEEHAISIFAKNLRSLLMQAPVRGFNILGVDPAYRTGCKIVVINSYGDLLTTTTIYPHAPQGQWDKSLKVLKDLVKQYQIALITIGNGTASRETENLVSEVISETPDVKYLVINEAGASVYSASELAREEFPELNVSMRGAVSIARRVLDPLAELVKIDPKSIGVGLYQHDVNQKSLAKSLEEVVESCVNFVGVELNSASAPLLKYVAGLSNKVAKEVISYRLTNGGFKRRNQLKEVKGLGPKAFQQCAGFLRIADGVNPLDNTGVHPESYKLAEAILAKIGFKLTDLRERTNQQQIPKLLGRLDAKELAAELGAGEPTIRDILSSLAQPGRDPRDELPAPLFRSDVLTIEDLKTGMILKGTVQNVVDFGAFVDIGVKKAGLVHVSQISEEYIKHPTDVLQVGDVVNVQVLSVDVTTGRIGLTMKIKS